MGRPPSKTFAAVHEQHVPDRLGTQPSPLVTGSSADTAVVILADAVRQLKGWVEHWDEDRACGLTITKGSVAHAKAIADRALKAASEYVHA